MINGTVGEHYETELKWELHKPQGAKYTASTKKMELISQKKQIDWDILYYNMDAPYSMQSSKQ